MTDEAAFWAQVQANQKLLFHPDTKFMANEDRDLKLGPYTYSASFGVGGEGFKGPTGYTEGPTESQLLDHAGGLLLQGIGEDIRREGLLDTPARFAKAWTDWTRGYWQDLDSILKSFEDGASGYDEMVIETDIPVYSKCEHHCADIFGVAHVGYIPNGKVVGLSKIVRVVELFARRLQVQERLTVQIADALQHGLIAKGVGVVLQCRHMCMESRGVNRPGVVTTTSCLRGAIVEQPAARAEFLSIINNRRPV